MKELVQWWLCLNKVGGQLSRWVSGQWISELVGRWLVVGGSLVFVGGSMNDLSVVHVSVIDGWWVGREPVGRSVVGYRWSVACRWSFGSVIRLKERKDWKMPCRKNMKPFVRQPKQLVGDDFPDNVKEVKAIHSMNQSISNEILSVSSSFPRNPTSFYSSNSKASTRINHSLKFGNRKKNFHCPQLTNNWNQKQQSWLEQNYIWFTLWNLNLIQQKRYNSFRLVVLKIILANGPSIPWIRRF